MGYESVWRTLDTTGSTYDEVYIPIGTQDRARLEAALQTDMKEHRDRGWGNPIEDEYWTERMEATHFFIAVTVPEDDDVMIEGGTKEERTQFFDTEATWWDFSSMLSKQVDGEWLIWAEDPSDVGNLWYQSTYYKAQAYAVRDAAIECATEDRLLVGDEYLGSEFGGMWDLIMGESR